MKAMTKKQVERYSNRLSWEMNRADYVGKSTWQEIDLEYTVQSEYDVLDNLDTIDIDTFSLKTAQEVLCIDYLGLLAFCTFYYQHFPLWE